jgi:hypothetical protein
MTTFRSTESLQDFMFKLLGDLKCENKHLLASEYALPTLLAFQLIHFTTGNLAFLANRKYGLGNVDHTRVDLVLAVHKIGSWDEYWNLVCLYNGEVPIR